MMKFCLINGEQKNHIDIENRGLAYGDGIFTTAKIQNGKIHYLTAHIDRLIFGCEKLGIAPPSRYQLTKQLNEVAKTHSLAVIKVIITASKGGRGYLRLEQNSHELIIMVHDYPNHYDELANTGINLGVSKQHIGCNPMLAGLKHLNRLEQVLFRQELATRTEDDLIVTNIQNNVIEATSANIFIHLAGKLFTSDVSQSGVDGIMRQAILKHYPTAQVKPLTLDDLANAQAIFICNCVMGVMPVITFNDRKLDIAIVQKIRQNMKKETNKYD